MVLDSFSAAGLGDGGGVICDRRRVNAGGGIVPVLRRLDVTAAPGDVGGVTSDKRRGGGLTAGGVGGGLTSDVRRGGGITGTCGAGAAGGAGRAGGACGAGGVGALGGDGATGGATGGGIDVVDGTLGGVGAGAAAAPSSSRGSRMSLMSCVLGCAAVQSKIQPSPLDISWKTTVVPFKRFTTVRLVRTIAPFATVRPLFSPGNTGSIRQ